jgi:hypothetical protein
MTDRVRTTLPLWVGVVLPLALAPGAAAQVRFVVPIVVTPAVPPAGRTQTRITVETPRTGGLGRPGAPAAGASVPATSQEIRITTRPEPAPVPAGAPVPGAPLRTRITVDPMPGPAGLAAPRAGGGFGSVPSWSRETRVRVQQDSGPGTPTSGQEILIQSNGDVDTPLVIVAE